MGVGVLNVWVSEIDDPCRTAKGGAQVRGGITVFDCSGVLDWPCGRYRTPPEEWHELNGRPYMNIPYSCGHLELEVPPGCYWVFSGLTTPESDHIHLNYASHVGIVEVGCDQTACVKLFNPSKWLCWDWFLQGLRIHAIRGAIDPKRVEFVANIVENELLADAPRPPIVNTVERVFADLAEAARGQGKDLNRRRRKE